MLLPNLLTFRLLLLLLKKGLFTCLITKNIRFMSQKQVVYKQCSVDISLAEIHKIQQNSKLSGFLNN